MKKIGLICTLIISTIGLHRANAQTSWGGGLLVVTEGSLNFGVDLRGTFTFDENWKGTASLDIYFPETETFITSINGETSVVEVKTSGFAIGAEANYFFDDLDIAYTQLYGIIGMSIVNINVDTSSGTNGFGGDYSGLNLSLGAGADFEITKPFIPFAEIKFSAGEANYATIIGGVKFPIN